MFDFLSMVGTYSARKIDTYEVGKLFIDTCLVTDSDQPYETAVEHPKYNNGDMVIVEMYNTKEAARKGHKRWVKKMTAKELPESLKDVSTSTTGKLCRMFEEDKL